MDRPVRSSAFVCKIVKNRMLRVVVPYAEVLEQPAISQRVDDVVERLAGLLESSRDDVDL